MTTEPTLPLSPDTSQIVKIDPSPESQPSLEPDAPALETDSDLNDGADTVSEPEGDAQPNSPSDSTDTDSDPTDSSDLPADTTVDTDNDSGATDEPASEDDNAESKEPAQDTDSTADSSDTTADESEPSDDTADNPEPEPDEDPDSVTDISNIADDDSDTATDEDVEHVAPWGEDTVVGFHAVSNADRTQSDVPVTLGQVFARGDVAQDKTVIAVVDGQKIPAQVNKKATWPDGSLRHAVITARLASLDAGESTAVELHTTDAHASGSPITLDQVLGTDFQAKATLDVNGTSYRADARDLLAQANQSRSCQQWSSRCKRWLSGPLASEWIVGGRLKTAGGQQSEHLSVYFNVRAYADTSGAVTNIRVDSVIENDWAYSPTSENKTYDANIQVGPQNYNAYNVTHYRQARWHKVLFWRRPPRVYARVDTDYLQHTGAISRYADVTPTEQFLDSRTTRFEPMDHGNQTIAMGNPGAQPAIGPLPRWTSTYVVSADRRAFDWMLANDDAVGSYSFHYRDAKTGRPLKVTDHPNVTLAAINYARRTSNAQYQADLLPDCPENGDCSSPYEFNIAHHPSIGTVAYLVTGDFYYLEEIQFTASYIELWANPRYRDYANGRLRRGQSQVRGQAWGLRSIADAAFATPDDDPMKPYFTDQIEHILADYNQHYVDHPEEHPLHVMDDGSQMVNYDVNGGTNNGIAPWQAHFFVWAVGHVAEQGVAGARRFADWLAAFPIAQMTNWTDNPETGYCWTVASAYELQIKSGTGYDSPTLDNLDQAYAATFPRLQGLSCDSQPLVNTLSVIRLGEIFIPGQMYGYAGSPTGFPANLQIGLAMAVDSGLTRSQNAWGLFENRSVKPDYSDYPNFAVVPRG